MSEQISTESFFLSYAATGFLPLGVCCLTEMQVCTTGAAIGILPKIESADSVGHLSDILDAADGAMVARGDLGAELPVQEVGPFPTPLPPPLVGCPQDAMTTLFLIRLYSLKLCSPPRQSTHVLCITDVYGTGFQIRKLHCCNCTHMQTAQTTASLTCNQ